MPFHQFLSRLLPPLRHSRARDARLPGPNTNEAKAPTALQKVLLLSVREAGPQCLDISGPGRNMAQVRPLLRATYFTTVRYVEAEQPRTLLDHPLLLALRTEKQQHSEQGPSGSEQVNNGSCMQHVFTGVAPNCHCVCGQNPQPGASMDTYYLTLAANRPLPVKMWRSSHLCHALRIWQLSHLASATAHASINAEGSIS